jgi:hypothetical protein
MIRSLPNNGPAADARRSPRGEPPAGGEEPLRVLSLIPTGSREA